MSDEPTTFSAATALREIELLRRDLAEARAASRNLQRQVQKLEEVAAEAQRAHAKMVATLTETMRENTILTGERDMWRQRATRRSEDEEEQPRSAVDLSVLAGQITDAEANAIRKAMARLHHPDVGGDPERMKQWNAALDRLVRN